MFIQDSLVFFQHFGEDELKNRGILYSIQVAIESTDDLVAMLVKDLNMIVSDDATNIASIIQHVKEDPKLSENLIRANGLRNVIVHQYNGIQKKIIAESIDQLKRDLSEWVDLIEGVVAEIEGN